MTDSDIEENQAPVVRRVDSAIHWITQLVLLVFIRWMVIYQVDSVIHLLNNRDKNVKNERALCESRSEFLQEVALTHPMCHECYDICALTANSKL